MVQPAPNIVCNPPFDIFKEFSLHALGMAGTEKVAMIWLVRTLPAARWLQQTPLKRILLLTPRPSMPPGHVIARGEKVGGGKQDFCWLIWERGFADSPSIGWLHRDEPTCSPVPELHGRPVSSAEAPAGTDQP